MHAVRAQCQEVVTLLLEKGIDPTVKNNRGRDAVMMANRNRTISDCIHERIQFRKCLKFQDVLMLQESGVDEKHHGMIDPSDDEAAEEGNREVLNAFVRSMCATGTKRRKKKAQQVMGLTSYLWKQPRKKREGAGAMNLMRSTRNSP